MKSYDEMAESVLRRYDEYRAVRKKRMRAAAGVGGTVCCVGIMALAGTGIGHSRTNLPMSDESSHTETFYFVQVSEPPGADEHEPVTSPSNEDDVSIDIDIPVGDDEKIDISDPMPPTPEPGVPNELDPQYPATTTVSTAPQSVGDETTMNFITSVEDWERPEPDPPEPPDEPHVGGSDFTFSLKFINKVYNIYIIDQIVGQETCDEWVNNVYLKQTLEEMDALPDLYQAIVGLNVSKEDFIKQNNKYIDYPSMYFTEDIIDALYMDDIEEMKRLLRGPYTLYYNGEIYTFDAMSANPHITDDIPADVLNEYLDFIESVCVDEKLIKYYQAEIDRLRK